jgi:hypothetical protein
MPGLQVPGLTSCDIYCRARCWSEAATVEVLKDLRHAEGWNYALYAALCVPSLPPWPFRFPRPTQRGLLSGWPRGIPAADLGATKSKQG